MCYQTGNFRRIEDHAASGRSPMRTIATLGSNFSTSATNARRSLSGTPGPKKQRFEPLVAKGIAPSFDSAAADLRPVQEYYFPFQSLGPHSVRIDYHDDSLLRHGFFRECSDWHARLWAAQHRPRRHGDATVAGRPEAEVVCSCAYMSSIAVAGGQPGRTFVGRRDSQFCPSLTTGSTRTYRELVEACCRFR